MEAIDLGIKSPGPVAPGQTSDASDVHFPSLYIDSDQPLPDLPDEGTMTIAFKRGGRSMNESAEGQQRRSCSIQVTKILSVEAGDSDDEAGEQESNDQDTEATLDKYAAEEVAPKKPAKEEEAD